MKIFITGGTGFIGKYIVDKLQNNELLILTRDLNKDFAKSKKIQFVQGTLGNINKWKNKIKNFKPDATIHMAWEGIPDYGVENSTRNLNYGLDLYRFLVRINCKKILTTGSCWEYGEQSGKLSENILPKTLNAFATAKNSLLHLGQEIAKKNGISFIWTRLFYVYGPGQKKESLIPYLINCAKEGKNPEIKNPQAQNDFIYVEDVADAISKLILECNVDGIFNIGSGKLTSIQAILKKIYDMFFIKQESHTANIKQTYTSSANYADISKIEKEVGWKPETTIKEGIKKVMNLHD